MKRTYKTLRKIVVFIVGATVFIVGLALLVLPGPGLLTMAAGLLILSSEFEWAERHLANVKRRLKQAYDEAKNKQNKKKHSEKED